MKRTTTTGFVWPRHRIPEPERTSSWRSLERSWVSIRRLPGHIGTCVPKRTARLASVGGALAAGALFSVCCLLTNAYSGGIPTSSANAGGAATPTRVIEPAQIERASPGTERRSLLDPTKMTVCQHDPEQGPEMILLAGGEFQQGSESGDADEAPVRTVKVPQPFAIGRCEVTVGAFRQFVEETNYQTDAEKGDGCFYWDEQEQKGKKDTALNWKSPGFEQTDQHSVTCVSWTDAQAYITWLNSWLGLDKSTSYRLPSESEWEFATRAGTTTPFFWGNRSQCQFVNGLDQSGKQTGKFSADWTYADCDDGFGYTAPVGSFSPNRWGLYDMSGNVWEWVQDCYQDSYSGAPTDGTAREATEGAVCEGRSLRGGGWSINPQILRSADRGRLPPGEASDISGFRLARTP